MLTLSIKELYIGNKVPLWVDKEIKSLSALSKKIDKKTCIYCRFKSDKFQERHHIDGNHSNNKPSNITSICPLCHASFHIDATGTKNKGYLVWLPEWKQEHLNRYSIFLQFIINTTEVNNPYNIKATDFFEELLSRYELLKSKVDLEFSDLNELSKYMHMMTPQQYNQRQKALRCIRIAPNFDSDFYKERMEYWTKMFTKSLPVSKWPSIIDGASS